MCETTNRNKHIADKVFGHTTAGLFSYTHITGGYPGGQAEYLRVPYADTTHIKIPDGVTDEPALFLGDIFPTGWQAAVQCDIEETDTVAVWGCGPVGQMAIRSALTLRTITSRPLGVRAAFLWLFIWSLRGTLTLRNLSFLGSDQMDNLLKDHS